MGPVLAGDALNGTGEAGERPFEQCGVPGPNILREQPSGPRHCRTPVFRSSYSSATSTSTACSLPFIPRTTFTFSSTSAIIAGLSLRNSLAFSRPWPMR